MSLSYFINCKLNPPKDTKPSFSGRNVLVTGANTGIGYEAAMKFVQCGADRVILAVRTISKGESAQAEIEKHTGRKGVAQVWQLDMLDYASIKAFVKRVGNELEHLDIACLNAGVVYATYQQTAYGWEKTLQVNVLSTTLLGLLLMPKLRASKTDNFTPVMELVGSEMHLHLSSLKWEKTNTGPLEAYNHHDESESSVQFSMGQYAGSKLLLEYAKKGLANLAMNHKTHKPDILVISVSPGPAKSELGRDHNVWYMRMMMVLFQVLLQRTTEQGARSYISGAALSPEAHGRFWNNDHLVDEAPLVAGEKGDKLQAQVWQGIINGLKKDMPEVEAVAAQ